MIWKVFAKSVIGLAILFGCSTIGLTDDASGTIKQRKFRFNYGATLTKLPAGKRVRIWLPVPQEDEYQQVDRLTPLTPSVATISADPTYGNKILYFEMLGPPSASVAFQTSYQITRSEVRNLTANRNSPVILTDAQKKLFLEPQQRVPLDGKPLALIRDLQLPSDPLAMTRKLYDRVDEHVKYDKSKPGYGLGDVNWVCDSWFGNCTDFHSLFISFTRSQGIPARFEIGFPLPPKRGIGTIGGYHCWAHFHTDENGWVPVDISEADKYPDLKDYYFGNLTENRVAFTTGRDITLVPRQAGEPLNYFIYPYVEVDGIPLHNEDVRL